MSQSAVDASTTMGVASQRRRMGVLVIASMLLVLYAVFLSLFYEKVGSAATIGVTLPCIVMAVFLGLRPGFVFALFSIVVQAVILGMVLDHPDHLLTSGFIVGHVLMLFVIITLGTMRDGSVKLRLEIEKHKKTRVALSESEDKYRNLVELASDGVAILNGMTLRYVNSRMGTMLGQLPGDLIGREFTDLLATGYRTKFVEFLNMSDEKVSGQQMLGIAFARGDGGEIHAELSFGQVPFDGEESILVIARDVSERRQAMLERAELEEHLRQTQKLEAVGRLAGGVAHDMNNVLSAVLSSAAVLADDTDKDDARIKDIDNIIQASKKGGRLTRDLLGFAKEGKFSKKKISLNDVASSALGLLVRIIPKTIETEFHQDLGVKGIEGDIDQLTHAMMNVCLNAVDAMPNSAGSLRIRTGNMTVEGSLRDTQGDLPPGEYSFIEVADDGVGMDRDTLARIFEPFFTTKEEGRGTGLGLSMVYGTVKKHEGTVSISSRVGKGSTVKLLFPSINEITHSTPPVDPATGRISGTGLVLLVDDEAMVRSATKRFLERLGYTVVLADNGETAIEEYNRNKGRIELVLLDIIMPKMDGYSTFEKLHELDPDLKIILVSGYCSDARVEKMLENGAVGFLQKPVDLGVLSYEMNRVLKEG